MPDTQHDECRADVQPVHLQDISEELEGHSLCKRDLVCGSVAPHHWSCLSILHHQQQLVCLRVICIPSNSLPDMCMLAREHVHVARPTTNTKQQSLGPHTAPELIAPKMTYCSSQAL